jgi:hypothetical protein
MYNQYDFYPTAIMITIIPPSTRSHYGSQHTLPTVQYLIFGSLLSISVLHYAPAVSIASMHATYLAAHDKQWTMEVAA